VERALDDSIELAEGSAEAPGVGSPGMA